MSSMPPPDVFSNQRSDARDCRDSGEPQARESVVPRAPPWPKQVAEPTPSVDRKCSKHRYLADYRGHGCRTRNRVSRNGFHVLTQRKTNKKSTKTNSPLGSMCNVHERLPLGRQDAAHAPGRTEEVGCFCSSNRLLELFPTLKCCIATSSDRRLFHLVEGGRH